MACNIRRDSEVWDVARAQHGLVTRGQLHGLGFTRSAISHRLQTRRLWRVHPSVYAVGRPELSREGRWLAAVLACGPGAALSHLCAACLWEIREQAPPVRPQVSVPTPGGRPGPRGIDLRRAATLRAEDVTARSAVPVTTLPRTLVDLAGVLDARRLKSAVRQAERVHKLDLVRLRVSLDDAPQNSHRHARLRRLLGDYVPRSGWTESDIEANFLELCARHGLPRPETQAPIGPYRADFLWRDLRLVVEIDGRETHGGFVAFREDRVRDRAMKAGGFEVLRFAATEVAGEPSKVVREVAAAMARLTADGSRTP